MASRKLGGGRILGSGRSLQPAVPPPAPPRPSARLVSPSESSTSLNSQSTETQDLSSRVSLDNGDAAAAAAASTKLVCPICNEDMMTLLQLNRHLDDNHQNLEEVQQDEVKDWFKAQMTKAKRFQPLAVLNQKLRGLDAFESNDAPQAAPIVANGSSATAPARPDPEEVVTKAHWQRSRPGELCAEPSCGKNLGPVNGSVHCRKCGKLFCEEHTMYQMKLSRSAQHEPTRGFWCRCCETCYISREGYNDNSGSERNHTQEFLKLRQATVDQSYLEVTRLEKRLIKLTQALATLPPDPGGGGIFSAFTGSKNQRKLVEQSVVDWEDDPNVTNCPFCQQEFTNYTFRRHHCRTCGRVVCADTRTGCSREIGLNVDGHEALTAHGGIMNDAGVDRVNVDVRLCRDCQHTLFSKRDFEASLKSRRPDVRAYDNLLQFERGIRLLLPKFQKLLLTLQDPDHPPTSAQLAEASKTRQRLTTSFSKYKEASTRIRDLSTTSATQKKLQHSIHTQASSFLHLHMLPLKSLPKVLKHASPYGRPPPSPLSNSSRPGSRTTTNGSSLHQPNGIGSGRALASIRYGAAGAGPSSVASSSSAISALESEEKELRERLMVLEEQRFFVQEMVRDAAKRRKFEEVGALGGNVEELGKEIDKVQGMLEQLDFRGAYMGEGSVG
ncbi:MAG: carboxypeptidase Y-deficient [Vezdaea aestivalis]|nr:MAG: carboxypeptidase Y-deficient [Vezdaea aestivalis]